MAKLVSIVSKRKLNFWSPLASAVWRNVICLSSSSFFTTAAPLLVLFSSTHSLWIGPRSGRTSSIDLCSLKTLGGGQSWPIYNLLVTKHKHTQRQRDRLQTIKRLASTVDRTTGHQHVRMGPAGAILASTDSIWIVGHAIDPRGKQTRIHTHHSGPNDSIGDSLEQGANGKVSCVCLLVCSDGRCNVDWLVGWNGSKWCTQERTQSRIEHSRSCAGIRITHRGDAAADAAETDARTS